MKQAISAALLLLPLTALAQQPPPRSDVILLPRDVALAAMNWIAQPEAANAVKLYAALSACINDNPVNGMLTQTGADQCPEVTAAIAARAKELTDLRSKVTKPTEVPAITPKEGHAP